VLVSPSHTLLKDPSILSQICENIVIPNIKLRESDEELFENDPEEFIRKDIEGSDLETRRRAAHVRNIIISKNFNNNKK
jgi:exportin-2 (importin alpha re-exporter)